MSNTTLPTTGWVDGYIWSNVDNATWTGFLMYQLYFSFVLLNEALLNWKNTFIWLVVFIAIGSNVVTSISGFFLLDCLTFNMYYGTGVDPTACDTKLHVYYFFSACTFDLGFWLLFYRKFKVVPETLITRGFVDMIVLLVCISLNLAANLPCLYMDLTTCFNQDLYQAIAAGISFAYFDVWFLIVVARKTFEKGGKWEVLQLSALTGSITAIYLAGSVSYKSHWGGNFYTNILWNMGYCILPLFCIDSVVSPKFLKLFVKGSQQKDTTSARRSSNQQQTTTMTPASHGAGGGPSDEKRGNIQPNLIRKNSAVEGYGTLKAH